VAVTFNFQIGCEEAHIIIYNCPFYRNRVFENKNFTLRIWSRWRTWGLLFDVCLG